MSNLSCFLCFSLIAYERYTAVCNPYEYRASISTQSTRKRVGKLLIPVAVLTVAINIPKFFETYTVEASIFIEIFSTLDLT